MKLATTDCEIEVRTGTVVDVAKHATPRVNKESYV